MNDFVEVGVFAPEKADPLYLTRHRIGTGKQTIRIIASQGAVARGVSTHPAS